MLFKCGMWGPEAEIVLSDSQNMSDGHQSSTSYFIVTRQLATKRPSNGVLRKTLISQFYFSLSMAAIELKFYSNVTYIVEIV